MRQKFWQWLATFIATHPRVHNAILKYAMKRPYSHIEGYMDRFWILPRWTLGRDEFGALFPKSWMPFGIRLHHILRPDDDRHLHDHPWDFRTMVVNGWYQERDIFGDTRILSTGDSACRRAETFHSITAMPPEGVLTIFIFVGYRNRWGFLVDGRKIYWKDYLSMKKEQMSLGGNVVSGLGEAVKSARGGEAPPKPMQGFA